MSKLGNIQDSFGKQISIAIANASANIVMQSTSLPENTLIITSPVDENGEDIGTHCLLMTDNYGVPSQLTYTFKLGNGLCVENGVIKLKHSDKFKSNNGVLEVNKNKIIDNNTLGVKNNKIIINQENLTHGTESISGVVKIDNVTLKVNSSNQIYVDTNELEVASAYNLGVIACDNKTINIDNGVISVVTQELDKATTSSIGVVKPDNNTIEVVNGTMAVINSKLTHASANKKGIAKIDGITILEKNGVISVNSDNIAKATNKSPGIVRFDGTTIQYENGIGMIGNKIQNVETFAKRLAEIDKLLEKLQVGSSKFNSFNEIYAVNFNSTSIFDLNKPIYGQSIIDMPMQHVYITLNISTNCKFKFSSFITNNINPEVEIKQIIYDGATYVDNECFTAEYNSTQGISKPFVILVNCKNFNGSNLPYSQLTDIHITISTVDNVDINVNLVYSIARYNSATYIELYDSNNTDTVFYIPIKLLYKHRLTKEKQRLLYSGNKIINYESQFIDSSEIHKEDTNNNQLIYNGYGEVVNYINTNNTPTDINSIFKDNFDEFFEELEYKTQIVDPSLGAPIWQMLQNNSIDDIQELVMFNNK